MPRVCQLPGKWCRCATSVSPDWRLGGDTKARVEDLAMSDWKLCKCFMDFERMLTNCRNS